VTHGTSRTTSKAVITIAIRLRYDYIRSDYDVSRAPASIRRDSTRAKNEHVNFYPLDAMLARVFATATCLSVRLSVRPSVRHTPVLCLAERKQDREMYTI